MTDPACSTIAQLLFTQPVAVNFARLVADLDTVLSRLNTLPHQLTWDCEDVALFDLRETRIALGWSAAPGPGFTGCLALSVGPSPLSGQDSLSAIQYDALCNRLVERVQSRFVPSAIVWHRQPGAVTPELIDTLLAGLPELAGRPALPELAGPMASNAPQPPHSMAPLISPPPSGWLVANDRPDLPPVRNPELARLRDALYHEADVEAGPSSQMRLAAHAMNASLIVVYTPLGAALMTYSLLRGTDMRVSARMLTITGVLAGLAASPFGQTMVALAGV